MAQTDDGGVKLKVGAAKAALDSAKAKFPSPKAVPSATPRPAAPVMKPAAGGFDGGKGIGAELKAKSDNVDQYAQSMPKMHNGGPVVGDGPRWLKDGEHVLTGPEAKIVRKHAMMAVGLKSLAKTPDGAGTPKSKMDKSGNASKKMTSGITVRPEKKQAAQVKQQMDR